MSPFLFRNLFSLRRAGRSRAIMAAVVIAVSAITLAWQQPGASAAFIIPNSATSDDTSVSAQNASGPSITISTIAGGGFSSNIPVKQAPMGLPSGVALDPQSRGFYVLDEIDSASLLRFVNTTTDNITLAGTMVFSQHINLIAGGGLQLDDGVAARDTGLATVTGLAVDPSGNAVYLSTPAGGGIRVLNVSTQNFTVLGKTIAPGKIVTVFTPSFADFRSLALHPLTNELYFIGDNAVYKLDANGNQTTYAGDGNQATSVASNGDNGPATSAHLTVPLSMAFDTQGNLLIAEAGVRNIPGSVRKVAAANNHTITTVATNLEYPMGLTISSDNNAFVALGNIQQIVRISSAGVKTVVAGNNSGLVCNTQTKPTCGDGGTANNADLSLPGSTDSKSLTMAADAAGFYLPDLNYKRVRYVNLSGATVAIAGTNIGAQKIDSIAGNGIAPPYDHTPATATELQLPTGVAADEQGNFFISDIGRNLLRFVNRGTGPITLFANTAWAQTVQPGQIITLNNNVGERIDDRISTTQFSSPQGLALTSKGLFIVDSQGGVLFPPTFQGKRTGMVRFLNTSSSDVTVLGVTVPPGMCSIVAGLPQGTAKPNIPSTINDGALATKAIIFPTDVAVDASGNLYIADQGDNRIRKVDTTTGIINTFYGNGSAPLLNAATGVVLDNMGRLLIADTRNNRILRQDASDSMNFSVIADNSLGINLPRGLTVDTSGKIFVTNTFTNQVLQIIAPDNGLGAVSVIAGTGEAGFSGDDGDAGQARLNLPNPSSNNLQVTAEIVALSNGVLAFTDTNNQRVRLMVRHATLPSPLPVTTVSGASFTPSVASESIVSAFGTSLVISPLIRFATSLPLPMILAGTTIKVKDSANVTRDAPMFFAYSGQINYLIPAGTATGTATITVTSADGQVSIGNVDIATVAPGFFTANSDGQGVPAAVLLRVNANNDQSYETISRFDSGQNRMVSTPIDLGPEGDQLFLIMFGTGIRGNTSLSQVSATIGGQPAEVLYAGAQGGFVGLDQVNIRIPRTLLNAVHGEVDLVLTVNGKKAIPVKINIL